MPSGGISLFFTIKDGASQVLTTIQNKTKALDKETQDLAQTTQMLEKAQLGLLSTQTKLKNDLDKQNKVVKEAQRAYDEYHDELSKSNLEKAIEEQARLKAELDAVNDLYNANRKSRRQYVEEMRKSNTAGSGTSGAGSDGGISSLAKGLATGQVGQMLAASIGEMGTAYLTSAIGTPDASRITDTLSGALSGAAAGAVAGLPGILIGGALGGVSGLISSQTKVFEAEDDAFKDYVQEAQETTLSDQQSMVETGSTIAGSREQTQIAFARRLGSDEAADEYLSRVEDMAARTNYGYDEITGYSKLLLNSYDPEEVFGVLQSLSDATAGLDLSSSDVDMMISGLSRMRTSGQATNEYLDYFRDRGIDVDQALADATGADRSQIREMASNGEIEGTEAAQAILDFIDQTFGGLSEELSGTYDAMVDNLADAEANLQAMAGKGYNQERGLGVQAQQDWLDEKGEELGNAYSMIGQWQASLENLAEQYERDALDAVMGGTISDLYDDSRQRDRLEELAEEYQTALAEYEAGNQEAGARMGQLLAEAQIIAQNEYNASEGAQLALQSQLDLADTIREDTASNEAFWDAGYRKGQEFSKGLADAASDGVGIFDKGGFFDTLLGSLTFGLLGTKDEPGRASEHATGLDYVPYDEFPALLHQGERVLTANEARAQDRNGGASPISVQITGEWHVRSDSDVDAIADAIVEKLRLARMAG